MATVKIERTVVIQALEETLNKLHEDYNAQDALDKEYQLAFEKWKKEIVTYAIKNIDKAMNIRTNYREWKREINIDYDISVIDNEISEEPKRTYETISHGYYKERVEEIQRELRILRMTKDEFISASTLKSIGIYL